MTSTSCYCLPLYNVSLIVFLNCKSLWIKASAKWINVNVLLHNKIFFVFKVVAYWLESHTRNRKVAGSSLGPAGIVGGGRECIVLSPPSLPRLEQGTKPPTAPRAPQHKWLPTALGVCVCVCVCVDLGWVKFRAQIPSMGHVTVPL